MSNILHFSSSNLYRHILGFITSLFRPAVLGPELYGLWNLLNVIPTYATHLHLGSRTAMRYQIPALEAQQQTDAISALKQLTFTGNFALNTFAAALMVLYALFTNFSQLVLENTMGLLLMALIVLAGCVYEQIIDELKGHQNFKAVSYSNYVRFTLNFVLTVVLIYPFGLFGALAALLFSILIALQVLWRQYAIPLHFSFNLTDYLHLVRFGAPIVALDLVSVLLRSVDKLLIALLLGMQALGYYAIASMLIGPLMNIPGASREVVEQSLMSHTQSLPKRAQLEHFFFKPLRVTAYLMPLMIGSICTLLPVFIDWFLPSFHPALYPTQLLLIAGFFMALSYPCRGIIVANQWQLSAALHAIFAVIFHAGFTWAMIELGFGIAGVAIASGASFLLLTLILTRLILQRLQVPWLNVLGQLGELFIPFLAMLGALYLTDYGLNRMAINSLFLQSVLALFSFWLLYAPCLVLAFLKRRIVK